jgi:hypothetical protein
MNLSNQNFQSSAPLSAEINQIVVYGILIAILVSVVTCSLLSKVSDGVIGQSEVVSYLQRMEDNKLTDDTIPSIDIQSSSSQSIVWGNLFMVRYTYVVNGEVQKTAYCTKGPDNPLFCSPYPPQRPQ